MRSNFLFSIALALSTLLHVSCEQAQSDQSLVQSMDSSLAEATLELQRQKEQLQEERDELARKNAELSAEKEQREAAVRAMAEAEKRTFPDDAPAGIWTVRMKCTESDCQNRSVGDVLTETWNLYYTGGRYAIQVANPAPNTNREYTGHFDGKSLKAGFFSRGNGFDSHGSARATVSLRMNDENTMSGTREVLNSDPCRIEYAVTATRTR